MTNNKLEFLNKLAVLFKEYNVEVFADVNDGGLYDAATVELTIEDKVNGNLFLQGKDGYPYIELEDINKAIEQLKGNN